jgi:hypothetical protein
VGSSAVFVTPENASCLAINNAFIAETASKLPTNVDPVRVVANFKGALNALSQSDLGHVLSLPDNRFGRMAPYLGLIDGMPIQVTQNVATVKGIANGTLGNLEYVHFTPDTQFRLVRDGATAAMVQLPSKPPDYAVIRVPRPQATAIRPGVNRELFPVFFATQAYSKMTVKTCASTKWATSLHHGSTTAISICLCGRLDGLQGARRNTTVNGSHGLEVESGGGQQAPTNLFARVASDDSERIDCIKTIYCEACCVVQTAYARTRRRRTAQ